MVKPLVLSLPVKAGENLSAGDILAVSGGYIVKNAANEVEPIGIAESDVDNSLGANGDQFIGCIRQGLVRAWVLVEDTDSASGYDSPIALGDALYVGGKVGAARGDGQYLVSGAGTNPVSANRVGSALEAEAGSIAADVVSQKLVYVNF